MSILCKKWDQNPVYEIRSDGSIWEYLGSGNTKECEYKSVSDGYKGVTLFNGKTRKLYMVHRLVAESFIPNPENRPFVFRLDGNRNNNHVDNLYWCPKAQAQAKFKAKLKERIRKSNESVRHGGEPDPWVVEYRLKNNKTKAKWKANQPKKPRKKATRNSTSFKKGNVAKNKLTPEQREVSLAKRRQRMREWGQNNKERTNRLARERRVNDISFRIKARLRSRLSKVLKITLTTKSQRTMKLLGCDMDFFLRYLESKFQEGMSFDNYGEWHLDHIIPCYHFDFSLSSEQEKCFHYTNIQPMWAIDNWRKNKKLLPPSNGMKAV